MAYPVILRGVITFSKPDWEVTFLQDSTAGIYIWSSPTLANLHSGDLVEIRGRSAPGDFAPVVEDPLVRVLGKAPFPTPRHFRLGELLTGKEDSQWIEVQGTVHSVRQETRLPPDMHESSGALVLGVVADGKKFDAWVGDYPKDADYEYLVDAVVTLRGACGTLYNNRRQLVGIQVFVPKLDQIQVEKPAGLGQHFQVISPIGGLMQFAPGATGDHSIRVQGVVTLVQPRGMLFVQDESGGVRVESRQNIEVQPGDRIDVTGFPSSGRHGPDLEEAVIRKVSEGSMPAPLDLTHSPDLGSEHDSQLVKVRGRLVDRSTQGEILNLSLQMGKNSYAALLRNTSSNAIARSVAVGSLLELTGIWSSETEDYPKPPTYRILLRSPQDLIVLESPSWWTSSRVVTLLAILALIVLGSALWVQLLRRQVEERTEALRATLESTADGIVVVGSAHRIIAHNRKFADMWGVPQSLLTSRDFDPVLKSVALQLTAPEAFLAKTLQISQDHEAQTDDCILCKDGRILERHSEPQRIKGRSVGRVWGFRDITERIAAEQKIRESELKYRSLVSNIPDVIWTLRADQKFTFVSPNIEKLSGFSLDEIYRGGASVFYGCVHRDDVDRVSRAMMVLFAKGEPCDVECRVRRKDGDWIWVRNRALTTYEENGMRFADGLLSDITRSKRAEESLRASEERYRELFENASDIIYTTDLDHRVTSLNRVGQLSLGYSAQEATHLNLLQLVNPKDHESIRQGIDRALGGDSNFRLELGVTAKDGRRLMLEVKPRLVYEASKPVGVQGIARDITGREEAELELRHAQKLESVGRLASGIAHEINTPIQFVGDNTRFLQDSFGGLQTLLAKYQELREAAQSGPVSHDLMVAVRQVEESVDSQYLIEEIPKALAETLDGISRVATIVRAMKEFAHPESRELAAADLNGALLSTLTVARNELKYVAEVETELGDLPLVVCNIGDLNQVFLNILVNAAHAIGEIVKGTDQRGKIRVSSSAEGKNALIAISDTGCGIPEAIRSRIFDPFFTTKEVGRGTGQGLAIAHSVVVDRHKGSLTFESEEGKGTTFFIRLPIDPAGCSKEREAA